MLNKPRLGELVYSKAGRDKGKAFLIVAMERERFAYIADGDIRRIENPKKKNLKHLRRTGIVAEQIASKLEKSVRLRNKEIKEAIAQLHGEGANTINQGG